MRRREKTKRLPLVPFLYAMAVSFFDAAREALDPVLEAIDGYRALDTDEHGKPAAPDHLVRKFAELPKGQHFRHIGACLRATTNLGLAYVHSFRLLSLLTVGEDALPRNVTRPHLTKLYDALPKSIRDELSETSDRVGSHDFEMELSLGPPSADNGESDSSSPRSFRQQLAYWQARGMLQESHLLLANNGHESVIRLLIPLRSMLVMDAILAVQIAPRLGITYKTMDERMSSRTDDPRLEWDGQTISVSLPDKLGRTVAAKWNPTVTSVIRIKEADADEWSPGFETPFNTCTFVDLKPNTEYELKVTHKNATGESKPAISRMKTRAT